MSPLAALAFAAFGDGLDYVIVDEKVIVFLFLLVAVANLLVFANFLLIVFFVVLLGDIVEI